MSTISDTFKKAEAETRKAEALLAEIKTSKRQIGRVEGSRERTEEGDNANDNYKNTHRSTDCGSGASVREAIKLNVKNMDTLQQSNYSMPQSSASQKDLHA